MTSARSPIDDLHDSLFDARPKKRGTRFERIAALVFAVLDEGDVRHHVLLRGEGRRARHWIDVEIQREGGTKRAIVECKHWRELVDQDVINSVVGRRSQLGADEAVVVTTVGFTSGAQDVAHDENVRLVRIHPLAEGEHWHGVVKEIRMRGRIGSSDLTHLQWRAVDSVEVERLLRSGAKLGVWGEDPESQYVEFDDGTPAERVGELLRRHPSPLEEGEFSYEVEFDGPRFLRLDDGRRIAIRALEWTERVTVSEMNTTIGPRSPGRLLIEEITVEGEPAKRVLMDHQLRMWEIDAERRVVRGAAS